MDPHLNSSFPSDENGALDVKPLRSLAPMFPAPLGFNATTQSIVPPFVCINPLASAASGSEACNNNGTASGREVPDANGFIRATPLSTFFQTPPSTSFQASPATFFSVDEDEDEDEEPSFNENKSASGRRIKRTVRHNGTSGTDTKRKRPNKDMNINLPLAMLPSSFQDPRESVEAILMTFDAMRRKLLQLDEGNDINRRPDLKAGATLMGMDLKANAGRRIGSVPGIEIGDIFYFRIELCLAGLHAPSMAGIDYMTARFSDKDEPVAICIVSSGGYENEDDDTDVLIYSGQGGSGKLVRKQHNDQKLERGNLALERSSHKKNEIRVVRSAKDISCPNGKIYIYDGLYKIEKSWTERSKTGFNIFKYKLVREPGQPDGIAVWKMTQRWKENPSSRGRVILPDISSGVENIPVCLVNDVDNERGPNHFTYVTTVKYLKPVSSMRSLQGCMCASVCLPGDKNCSCAQRHGGDLPYSSLGLLVSRKKLIYECSAACRCTFNCRNRVTQKGVRLHFEVFKTRDRGWGLRCWDPIRAGTFVCEYTGEVIDKVKVYNSDYDSEEDDYIFQATYLGEKASRWNFGPELLDELNVSNSSETFSPFPIIISAKRSGNISRFMNHSCSPNLFWQPVQHDHDDEGYPHIMFFALKHIPPMTELTYDYGVGEPESEKLGMLNGFKNLRTKKCLCGSQNCRGTFG